MQDPGATPIAVQATTLTAPSISPPLPSQAVEPLPTAPASELNPLAVAAATSPFAALMAEQVNAKQHQKRMSKAGQSSVDVRTKYWPDIKPEDLWLLDGKRGGFAQVPRTLSLIMNIINDITKRDTGKAVPAGKTYQVLWLRVFGEGIVRIDSEAEAAFEAGYEGQRNVTTFRAHMNLLKKMGFIDFKPGAKGPMQYVLLMNPYKVIKKLNEQKLIPDLHYIALLDRANNIGSGKELTE